MSISDRKRSSAFDFNDHPSKKFKDFVDLDEDLSYNELQIDLDSNIKNNDIAANKPVTWARPINGDYLNVTLPSGHYCYIKVNEENLQLERMNRSINSNTASQAYYNILEEAEELMRRKKERQTVIPEITENTIETSKDLWVKKYAPTRYTELLSTESVNRNLLSWLKCWDKHVFNKEAKVTSKLPQAILPGQFNPYFDEIIQVNQKNGIPVKKVVLLSGPPGLGKTTLAQIVARHCGYLPLEINASDDRSPENFRTKIDGANNSRVGAKQDLDNQHWSKPHCLILDEIDGTSAAAVTVLINAINASSKTEKSATTDGRKGKSSLIINRPVICICNDLYAPNLRLLRPLCHVIKITPPDYSQILGRLNEICKLEGIECDRTILTSIIDISNRDIRSSLNTLQFLKQQGINSVTNSHISTLNIGQKDVEINAFKVWQDIFTEPNLKKSYFLTSGKSTNELSMRSTNILKIAHSAGDLDRIISGIHENYLSIVRFKDIFLKGMSSATEWMVFNDLLSNKISNSQIYEMYRYKQYIIPFFHLSFASSAILPGSIQFPMSDSNAFYNHQKMQSIYESFISNQGSITHWVQSKQEIIRYILPSLVNIIQPTQLRPINTQLYSSKEKMTLKTTVDIMISTGLTYLQERMAELQYRYVLNPNIEEFVVFDLADKTRNELPYSSKQLIANEIIREKIRKSDTHRFQPSDGSVTVLNEFSQNRIGFIMQKAKELKTKSTIIGPTKNKESFNFRLGTKIAKTAKVEEVNPISIILNQPVWFKFKEGFSNAIKRPVKVKDL